MSIVTCDQRQMNVDMCRGGVDTGGGGGEVYVHIYSCVSRLISFDVNCI